MSGGHGVACRRDLRRSDLHLTCRFAAVQPVGVNKHFGRAENVEHSAQAARRVKSVHELSPVVYDLSTTITGFKSWIAWEHSLRFKYRATAEDRTTVLTTRTSGSRRHSRNAPGPPCRWLQNKHVHALIPRLARGRDAVFHSLGVVRSHSWKARKNELGSS
ncbi:MAG: hypothetical protein QOH31_3056 [Verrucomicrobiota bacterium]|jgi:hypothetical protein